MLSVMVALNLYDARSLIDVPAAAGRPRRAPRVAELCAATGLHWRDQAHTSHTYRSAAGH